MPQSSSRHSDSPSAGQKVIRISWNPKVYYHNERSVGGLCAMKCMLLNFI